MKTTLLLGAKRTDPAGNPAGPLVVIAGLPVDQDEARDLGRIFSDAKQLHRFPKGLKWVGFGTVEITDQAAHVGNDIAEQIQSREQLRLNRVDEELARAEAKKKHVADLEAAKLAIRKAAVIENNASAALKTFKDRLLDAQANAKASPTDATKAAVEPAAEKVKAAEEAHSAAKAALQTAKQTLADLKNPPPVPEPVTETVTQ